METVLRPVSVVWLVAAGGARTNERVLGIVAPKHAPEVGNNPIAIAPYYTGAIFGFSVTQKANVALQAIRIYGSLDLQRWPDPGDASEALAVVNKDIPLDGSVLRYPIGISSAIGAEIAARPMPKFLMLEYSCAGTVGVALVFQVRATFIGTPPYGQEPDDYSAAGNN